MRASSSKSLWEQKGTAAETAGSKSFQQQEPLREKVQGDNREKRSQYGDTLAVRAVALGWGAVGGLVLLAWMDYLLLALMLNFFLTGTWRIDWGRGTTGTSRASLSAALF